MTRTTDILSDLIGFASVSRYPNRALIDYVAERLDRVGVTPQIIPDDTGAKANLFATTGPAESGGVLLSGHTDVVPIDGQDWTVPAFTCTERDGRYYGRGTADMKGFVAAAINAFEQAAKRNLATPLHLGLSYDEEVGCLGVRSMISMLADAPVRPSMCIVGEPTEMGLATGHKGKTAIRADCIGSAAHSALAPTAVNALHLACDLVAVIRDKQAELAASGQHDPAYNIPYTTLHVGRMTGGVALNIVPQDATIDFEIRNLASDDPDAILDDIRAAVEPIITAARRTSSQAAISFTITNSYPGLETNMDSNIVELVQSLTGANTTIKVAFGTEGGLFSRDLGIPTIVCGPGSMDQGHKPDEFITAEQLGLCDDMLARLNDRLVSGL